jgi:hypothetical protein
MDAVSFSCSITFRGRAVRRPGRCEDAVSSSCSITFQGALLEDLVGARVLVSFSCSFTFWGAGGMKTWSKRGCGYLFLAQLLSPLEGGLKTWSVRGCFIFFLFNYFQGVLLEDLVGRGCEGVLLEDLVVARVRYLFLVHLLSGGRRLKTWSLRGCWIFFLSNYFPGMGASLRPGRCEVAGSFSCTKWLERVIFLRLQEWGGAA